MCYNSYISEKKKKKKKRRKKKDTKKQKTPHNTNQIAYLSERRGKIVSKLLNKMLTTLTSESEKQIKYFTIRVSETQYLVVFLILKCVSGIDSHLLLLG